MASSNRIDIILGFTADTKQANTQMNQLQNELKRLSTYTPNIGENLGKGISDANTKVVELSAILKDAFNIQTGKLDLNKFIYQTKQYGMSWKDIENTFKSFGEEGVNAWQQLNAQIAQADTNVISITKTMQSLYEQFVRTAKMNISYAVLRGITNSFKDAYNYAKDLNESLNNIRIVTGASTEKMAAFAKEASSAARALSATTVEYTDAALIYYQQGLSDEEVKARTDTTIKLANVTGSTAEETSSYLTAIWNNFAKGSENLEYYADVITKLGAATASSSEEIATGLSHFAAVADTVGLSYEYATAALATVVAQTRQSADTVGNSFKTIFARLESLSMGDTLEDGTGLTKYTQALEAVGVNIKLSNGELKNMDNILDELGGKWSNLSQEQKNALAYTVAGARQYTNFIALMDNYDVMKQNVGLAQTAEGTLEEQNQIYAESWEASMDRVTASFEKLYNYLVKDKFFITFNNILSSVIDKIAELVKNIGGLKTVLPLIANLMTKAFGNNIAKSLTNVGQFLGTAKISWTGESKQRQQEAQQGMIDYFTESDNVPNVDLSGLAENVTNALKNINDSKSTTEIQDNIKKSVNENLVNKFKEINDAEYNYLVKQQALLLDKSAQKVNNASNNYNNLKSKKDILTVSKQDLTETFGLNSKKLDKDIYSREEALALLQKRQLETNKEYLNIEKNINELLRKDAELEKLITDYKNKAQKLNEAKEKDDTADIESKEKELKELEEKIKQKASEIQIGTDNVKNITTPKNVLNAQNIVKTIQLISAITASLSSMDSLLTSISNADFGGIVSSLGSLAVIFDTNKDAIHSMFKTLNIGIKGTKAELGVFLVAILAIEVVIKGLKRLSEYLKNRNPKEILKSLNEESQKLSENVTDLTNQYNTLNDTISNLNSAKDTIASLTKGTIEWSAAVAENNQQVIDLLSKYDMLSSENYRIEDGVYEITYAAEQQIKQKQLESLQASQSLYFANALAREKNKINQQNDLNNAFNPYTQKDANKIEFQTSYSDEVLKGSANGLLTYIVKNSDLNNIEDTDNLNKLIDEYSEELFKYDLTAANSYAESAKELITESDDLKSALYAGVSTTTKNTEAIDNLTRAWILSKNQDDINELGLNEEGIKAYEEYAKMQEEKNLNNFNALEDQKFAEKYKFDLVDMLSEANPDKNITNVVYDATKNKYIAESLTGEALEISGETIKQGLAQYMVEEAIPWFENLKPNEQKQYYDENSVYIQKKNLKELLQDNNIEYEDKDNILRLLDEASLENLQNAYAYKQANNNQIGEQTLSSMLQYSVESDKNVQNALSTLGDDYTLSNITEQAKAIEKIAEASEEFADSLVYDDEALNNLSVTSLQLNKGVKELAENYDELAEIVTKVRKEKGLEAEADVDYINAINGLKKPLSTALGIEEELAQAGIEISNSFIEAAIASGDLQAAADGNVEAFERLRNTLAEELFVNFKISAGVDEESIQNSWIEISSYITDLQEQTQPIQIGARVDENTYPEIFSLFQQIIDSANLTAEQIDALFSSLNWKIKLDEDNNLISAIKLDNKNLNLSQTNRNAYTNGKKSGGSQKSAKDIKDEIERYYEINQQLDEINNNLDRISKYKDRAFGKKRLEYLDQEIAQYERLAQAQQRYLDEAKSYLSSDMNALAAYGAIFNADGTLANYNDLINNQINAYNAALSDEAEEQYNNFKEALSKYEDSLSKVQSESLALIDATNQLYDAKLEKITYEVEYKIHIDDRDIEYLEWLLGQVDENSFDVAESIALLTKQAEDNQKKYETIMTGINKWRAGHSEISEADWNSFISGAMSAEDIAAKFITITEDEKNQLEEWADSLMNVSDALQDVSDKIQDQIVHSIDAFNDKLDTQKRTLENLNNILTTYDSIVQLLGLDLAGVSKDIYNSMGDAMVNIAKKNLEINKIAYEAQAQAYLDNMNNDALTEETKNSIRDAYYSAAEEYVNSLQEALNQVAEQFSRKLNLIVDEYNKKMGGIYGSLSNLRDAFNKQNELDNLYLDRYQQTYELSKLLRNINNSIDDTASIKGKQVLAGLLNEINDIQEAGTKINEYDLEVMQRKYDLYLAQIALEEAQNAKSEVRMTRDSEGNMSYTYVADQDAITNAQQNYDDKLYALEDATQKRIDSIQEMILAAMEEYINEISQLNITDQERVDLINNHYAELQETYGVFMNQAIMDADWIVKELQVDEQELINSFDETTLSHVYNIQTMDELNQLYYETTSDLIYQLKDDYETFTTETEELTAELEAAIQDHLNRVNEETTTAGDTVQDMANSFKTAFNDAINAANTFNTKYASVMNNIKESTKVAVNALNTLLAAMAETGQGNYRSNFTLDNVVANANAQTANILANGSGKDGLGNNPNTNGNITYRYMDKYYTSQQEAINKRNNFINDPLLPVEIKSKYNQKIEAIQNGKTIAKFASGGYTGTWGPNGKLAMLHEKELVLNKKDTSNILGAVDVVRDLVRSMTNLGSLKSFSFNNMLKDLMPSLDTGEQNITINADFPNVSSKDEIKEAFKELALTFSQYTNRKA